MVLKQQERGIAARHDIEMFIHDYWESEQMSPSVRDIAVALDMNISSVHYHLKTLVEQGVIKMHPRRARSIQRI
jgi:SOS-response transcriptional repressor LexA